jgi:hypothetical protein
MAAFVYDGGATAIPDDRSDTTPQPGPTSSSGSTLYLFSSWVSFTGEVPHPFLSQGHWVPDGIFLKDPKWGLIA